MRILIVEDDLGIVTFLEKGLKAEGYQTSHASDVAHARIILASPEAGISLILLDLGLPDEDGLSFLISNRGRGDTTPVIVLTARGEVPERVAGLNAGASDYVVKPFAFDELLARIRVNLRSESQPKTTDLNAGDLHLNLLTKIATRGGRHIELAQREWALLDLFMRHQGQVLSRAQILSAVWDFSFDTGSNIVDVYVGYLRKKLDTEGQPSIVQTVRGAGYRFVAPAPAEEN